MLFLKTCGPAWSAPTVNHTIKNTAHGTQMPQPHTGHNIANAIAFS